MKSKAVSSLLAFLLAIQFPCGQCGFGGYVDPTFNCPATITCPLVCVSFYEECPPQMRCPEPLLPCADGSCDAFCNNTNLVSPCEKECASVACPRVVATYDSCFADFGPWYEYECNESKNEESIIEEQSSTWVDLEFVLVYSWVFLNTVLIVAWSWYK